MKQLLIGVAFVAIIASLGSALVFMMRDGSKRPDDKDTRARRMWLSLAARIGLSVLLFVCILLAWKLGWIQPTGLPINP